LRIKKGHDLGLLSGECKLKRRKQMGKVLKKKKREGKEHDPKKGGLKKM